MKKEILKEISCYAGCIAFIALSAYISGIFKETSYQSLSNTVVNNVKASGIEQYINQERSPRKKVTVYKNYRPRIIPDNVIAGSDSSHTWRNIFNSNKKVVFYLYNTNDDFHSSIYNYFKQNKLSENYNFEPYSSDAFNNMRNGTIGPSKICDSLEECNRVRANASNYTLLTNFLSNCGKTMCIFNPAKNEYVQLKRRDITEAEHMLNGLQNWH